MKAKIKKLSNFIFDYTKSQIDDLLGKQFVMSIDYFDFDYVGDDKVGKDEYYKKGSYFGVGFEKPFSRKKLIPLELPTNIPNFIYKSLAKDPNYIQLIDPIRNIQIDGINNILKNYIIKIIKLLIRFEEEINPNFIEDLNLALLKIIKHKSKLSERLYLMNGVWLKCENINLVVNNIQVSIRRPQYHEWLKYKKKLDLKFDAFRSFLKIQIVSNTQKVSPIFAEEIFTLIRLYKLGSVYSDFMFSKTEFDSFYESTSMYNFNFIDRYNFFLEKTDQRVLQKFMNFYYPKVTKILKVEKKKKSTSKDNKIVGLYIAIDHYSDVVLNHSMKDSKRITSAIMGLESLYNRNDDKETIGFKLKTRVAKLFDIFGYDSLQVSKDISKGYSIRSSFAHGNLLDHDVDMILEERIYNYLRISILIFINLLISKNEFITQIDRSFHNSKERVALKKMVDKDIKKNILKFGLTV